MGRALESRPGGSAGVRAATLNVEPSLALGIRQAHLLAGNAAALGTSGLLDAGVWEARAVGFAIAVRGEVEVGDRAWLTVEGRFVGLPPQGDAETGVVTPGPEASSSTVLAADSASGFDEVVIGGVPETGRPGGVTVDALGAGGRLGLVVGASGGVALGPWLGASWSQWTMDVAGAPGDPWCASRLEDGIADPAPDCGYTTFEDPVEEHRAPGLRERLVYGTVRGEVVVQAGVEVRFGVARR